MSEDTPRDPYNTAVAAVVKNLVDDQMGIVRASKLTGIPRSTLDRYLNGERDIPIARLRLIANALKVSTTVILDEAEGRIK